MNKVFIALLLIATSLLADFKTLSTQDVEEAIKKGIPLIDIRRAEEFKRYGIIKGSHKLTFFDATGRYNIVKWMDQFTKIIKEKDQAFILVCAHANRTKVVGKFLSEQAGYKNVFELEGGINYGWRDKGKKTVK